jgi:putative membrane protein
MAAKEWLSVYLKGIAMGSADAVPGVSGGTIALITGIYERLITAITELDPMAITLVPGAVTTEGRARIRERFVGMDIPFLIALGLGVVTALVTVSRAVHYAEQTYPGLLFAFFFGLIGASAIILRDEVDVSTPPRLLAGVAGFALAFVLAGELSGALPHSLPVIAVAGAIAICAMILPGISGALILLLLGQYIFLTETLSGFVDTLLGVVGGGDPASLVEPGTIVVVFVLGAVVGLFSVAHAVKWALRHYRQATLTFLVALMVGALRYPAGQVLGAVETWSPITAAAIVGSAAFGALLVVGVDYVTGDIDIGGETGDPAASTLD